jgi:hypothetical protein
MTMRTLAFAALIAVAPLAALQAQTLPPGHPPMPAETAPATISHGTVLETIDVNPYVYVRVKTDGGELWLAAPTVTLAKGARISWPDGMVMTNYHSRSLDRVFDRVTFVTAITTSKP